MYVRRKTRVAPQIVGGGQERMFRGGTENVPGIVGMGAACAAAQRDLDDTARTVGALRDRFEAGVLRAFPAARVNGQGAQRIHNTSNISFPSLQAEAILLMLSEAGICASSGAACSSGSLEPSHVLQAMGIEQRLAHGAVRFSFSRFNSIDEVDRVVAELPALLAPLTNLIAGQRS